MCRQVGGEVEEPDSVEGLRDDEEVVLVRVEDRLLCRGRRRLLLLLRVRTKVLRLRKHLGARPVFFYKK
jgi:hypothetical protein